MEKVKGFIYANLDLQTAEDKTKRQHATAGTLFLGYKVQIRTSASIVKTKHAWGTH